MNESPSGCLSYMDDGKLGEGCIQCKDSVTVWDETA